MTDQADRSLPKSTKKTHPASGARVLTTGISVAAGIGLIRSIGLAARAQETPAPVPETIVQQVVVSQPQGETVIYIQQGSQTPQQTAQLTPQQTRVEIPAAPQPVQQVVTAPAATQSQGS